MAARAADVPVAQVMEEKGMRLVAEFLNGKHPSLTALLHKEDPAGQPTIRIGMIKGLLRNIVLPRDEILMQGSEAAISSILELAGQDAEITAVCTEIGQILAQYSGHKDQVLQQLSDSIRTQLAQQLQQQTGETVDINAIDPTIHPQYQKEWEKARGDLNEQYLEALTQRKDILMQRFC